MKRYNQFLSMFLMIAAMSFTSCLEDEDLLDGLKTGALVNAPASVEFVIGTSTSVAYELDIQQNDPGDVASVAVFKSITVGDMSSNEVQLGTFSTFPANIDLDETALLSGLQIDGSDVTIGQLTGDDAMQLRYEINMSDGRVLNPLNSTTIDIEE